jgi:hypothetical protein
MAASRFAQASYFAHGYRGDWTSFAGVYIGLLSERKLGETMKLQHTAALLTPRVCELLEQTLHRSLPDGEIQPRIEAASHDDAVRRGRLVSLPRRRRASRPAFTSS